MRIFDKYYNWSIATIISIFTTNSENNSIIADRNNV